LVNDRNNKKSIAYSFAKAKGFARVAYNKSAAEI